MPALPMHFSIASRSVVGDPARITRASATEVNAWLHEHGWDHGVSSAVVRFSRLDDGLPPFARVPEGTLMDALHRHHVSLPLRSLVQLTALQRRASEALRARSNRILTDIRRDEDPPEWMPGPDDTEAEITALLYDERSSSLFLVPKAPNKVSYSTYAMPSMVEAASAVHQLGVAKRALAAECFGPKLSAYFCALTDVNLRLMTAVGHNRASELANVFGRLLSGLHDDAGQLSFDVLGNWDRRTREKCLQTSIKIQAGTADDLQLGYSLGVPNYAPRSPGRPSRSL
jgi:hypothetical protein